MISFTFIDICVLKKIIEFNDIAFLIKRYIFFCCSLMKIIVNDSRKKTNFLLTIKPSSQTMKIY